MAIYFQPARHLHTRTHTHAYPYSLSRSRFNAVSFFNSDSSSLETHPSCRVTHPRGHVDRDTPYLLSPPRHPSPTRITSSLRPSLATHWHEMNLCKGASIDFTEIVFETSCWETFGKFLGWFSDSGVKPSRSSYFPVECHCWCWSSTFRRGAWIFDLFYNEALEACVDFM